MTNNKEHFVGIDVAKEWFDVAVLGEKRTQQFASSKRGITKLLKQMLIVMPKLIVVEATGGYEESLVLALFEAGLPVALVSPQRVRQYARQRTPGQDRPAGCLPLGGVWQDNPTTPV